MSNKTSEFIAHFRDKDKAIQTLWDHLDETSVLAASFASKIGLAKYGELLGLCHDLGKATLKFYNYISLATGYINSDEDDYVNAMGERGKIDHSTAGAQLIYTRLKNTKDASLAAHILSLVVVSHHSGLIDCLTTDGYHNLSKRLSKSDEKTRFNEVLANLDLNIADRINIILSEDELASALIKKVHSLKEQNDNKHTMIFKLGLLIRFFFSCLIDADRLSTSDFENPWKAEFRNNGNYSDWPILIKRLEDHLIDIESIGGNGIEQQETVNTLRRDISRTCYEFSSKAKGLYQLTVPTGGGKTLSSLRFALNHANSHKMERIIYVIPYTSIIDQNAQKAREILEKDNAMTSAMRSVVLEHHSNLTPDEENSRTKLLSENWDAPIVFTTMVQFLETLYGYGTRSVRRMHQLANAVIIFDEIQTLPIRCVYLFNLAIRFLISGCGSSIVLCTATQPLLDQIKKSEMSLIIAPEQQIIPDAHLLYKKLKRVDVIDQRKFGGWDEDEVALLAEENAQSLGSVLIVVNTKKSAMNLYKKLSLQSGILVFHLSTNMCPSHRLDTLNNIKKLLGKSRVICVSTQLIEAGVDIDFGSVIRYLAGLDSIAQAAGRCNRNGLQSTLGKVLIVNCKDEKLDNLIDIKVGQEKTERVLNDFKNNPQQFDYDLIGLKAMERYYQYYFHERNSEMCYPVSSKSEIGRSDNLFDLLSTNPLSLAAFKRIGSQEKSVALSQSFMAASKIFKAIDAPTRGVVVPYGVEGIEIINDLCAAFELEKQYKLLRRAQRFSVNIFPHVFEVLAKQKAIHEAQPESGIYCLEKEFYDLNFGLSTEQVNEMELNHIGTVI